MTVLATKPVDLDEDFVYTGEITKAEKLPNGVRRIVGVASGIEEDRDGERVSARGIAKMVTEGQALARNGSLPLTSSHTQDWVTEFGKVVALERDPETHQLILDTHLPPSGVDAIADKAWLAYEQGKKLGFSVGGKLRKAFHEIDSETGKRRRVLDDIALRHVMLTEHPSYDKSFALAVAKSFAGDPPPDEEFTVELDLAKELQDALEILKAAKPDDEEPEPDPAATPAPANAAGEGDATAPGTPGDAPTPAPGGDDDEPEKPSGEVSDAEMAAGLPMARHLSCPNCGHEFAADLPDTGVDDSDTAADDDDDDKSPTTQKTTETPAMSDEILAKIRELVAGSDVAKKQDPPTPDPAAAGANEDVMKTVQTIAAGLVSSHEHTTSALTALEEKTSASFENVGKAIQGLVDVIAARPQGRRSIARVIDPRGEVEKTRADEDEDVGKAVDDAPSAQSAMGELNKRNPAYAHHYAN